MPLTVGEFLTSIQWPDRAYDTCNIMLGKALPNAATHPHLLITDMLPVHTCMHIIICGVCVSVFERVTERESVTSHWFLLHSSLTSVSNEWYQQLCWCVCHFCLCQYVCWCQHGLKKKNGYRLLFLVVFLQGCFCFIVVFGFGFVYLLFWGVVVTFCFVHDFQCLHWETLMGSSLTTQRMYGYPNQWWQWWLFVIIVIIMTLRQTKEALTDPILLISPNTKAAVSPSYVVGSPENNAPLSPLPPVRLPGQDVGARS